MPAIIRNNLSLKIISLVAAIVIWTAVRAQTDPVVEQRIRVKVVTTPAPSGMQVLSVEPSEVQVTVRGRYSMFQRGGPEYIKLAADVSGSEVGTHGVPLRVQHLRPGLQLVAIERQRVQVELDTVVTESRPVLAQSRGRCAEGYAAKGWQVQPNEVQISGAASDVQRVDRVVAVVDLAGASATIKRQVVPQPRDEANMAVENIRIEPAKVAVTIPVERVNTKTVPIRPNIGPVPSGWEVVEVQRAPTTVTIAGSGEALADISAIDTARVDISDLRGTSAYSVPLQVPSGVTVLGPSSARVTVSLRRVERDARRDPEPPASADDRPATDRPAAPSETDRPPSDQDQPAAPQRLQPDQPATRTDPSKPRTPEADRPAERPDARRTPADGN